MIHLDVKRLLALTTSPPILLQNKMTAALIARSRKDSRDSFLGDTGILLIHLATSTPNKTRKATSLLYRVF